METNEFFSEYIWTRGEAAKQEMKMQYIEGIKELISLGVYSSVDFEIETIGSNEIWRQLLKSGSDRTNRIAVNCEPGFFTDTYRYIKVASGVRKEHTERIVHPGHEDISGTVEKTISFLEENDDELDK